MMKHPIEKGHIAPQHHFTFPYESRFPSRKYLTHIEPLQEKVLLRDDGETAKKNQSGIYLINILLKIFLRIT